MADVNLNPERNAPCPCGSGKQYQHCCEGKAAPRAPLPEELNQLVALFQAGRPAELESGARALLERYPDSGFAWKALGLSLQTQGKDALPALQKAADLSANDAQAHYNLGQALQELGQLDKAAASYRRALGIQPDYAQAHNNLGITLKGLGQLEDAVVSYRRALQIWPGNAITHNNLGIILKDLGQIEEAAASFRRALEIQPDYVQAHNNLGIALLGLGQIDEAAASFRRTLELKPDYAEAHNNLGVVLKDLGQLDEAGVAFEKALLLRPGWAEALNNLGMFHAEQEHYAKALEFYTAALASRSDYAMPHANAGMALGAIGNQEAARHHFECALALEPGLDAAHYGLALFLLKSGEFGRGWKEYEWRLQHVTGKFYANDPCQPGNMLPRPSSYLPVAFAGKRFFLLSDQGIGDELFFLRFAPEIRRRGGWLAYRASPKLQGLLARSAELDQVVGASECPPAIDYTFLVGETPQVLEMQDNDSLPLPFPLAPLREDVARMRARLAALGSGPFLGVTWWAGTPRRIGGKSSKSPFRNIPHGELARALRQWPGQVLVLQRNPEAVEAEEFAAALGRPVHDFSAANENLEEMLALLSLLDDYVGVSNTNMHLSAGLGKPCRVLVTHPSEWLWMAKENESPWFPGFRLYRQTCDKTWDDALGRLARDLSENYR